MGDFIDMTCVTSVGCDSADTIDFPSSVVDSDRELSFLFEIFASGNGNAPIVSRNIDDRVLPAPSRYVRRQRATRTVVTRQDATHVIF